MEQVIPEIERSNRAPAATAASANTPPLLEWVVAAVGLALLLSVLGFLLYDALARITVPPDIAVKARSVTRTGNGYRVSFRASNHGRETAEGVIVQGEIRRDGVLLERSWVRLDYLPAASEKTGGLFFSQDPRQFEFVLRALGYKTP